ncbi:MAG: hypothetical protein GXP45_08020 [bacterium]|nr:hypothetical protein [bacterium]
MRVDKDCKYSVLSHDACNFVYRDSIFKQDLAGYFLVTAVVFHLYKNKSHYYLNTSYQGIQRYLDMKKINIDMLSQRQLVEIISQLRSSKLPDYKLLGTA